MVNWTAPAYNLVSRVTVIRGFNSLWAHKFIKLIFYFNSWKRNGWGKIFVIFLGVVIFIIILNLVALLFNLIYIKEGSVVLKGDHLREFIFSKNSDYVVYSEGVIVLVYITNIVKNLNRLKMFQRC